MKAPESFYPKHIFTAYSDFSIIEIKKKNGGINVLILTTMKKTQINLNNRLLRFKWNAFEDN